MSSPKRIYASRQETALAMARPPTMTSDEALSSLSPREQQIATLRTQGYAYSEIARLLAPPMTWDALRQAVRRMRLRLRDGRAYRPPGARPPTTRRGRRWRQMARDGLRRAAQGLENPNADDADRA